MLMISVLVITVSQITHFPYSGTCEGRIVDFELHHTIGKGTAKNRVYGYKHAYAHPIYNYKIDGVTYEITDTKVKKDYDRCDDKVKLRYIPEVPTDVKRDVSSRYAGPLVKYTVLYWVILILLTTGLRFELLGRFINVKTSMDYSELAQPLPKEFDYVFEKSSDVCADNGESDEYTQSVYIENL